MYGLLGAGASGSAIVTGRCEDVADAPSILVSPRSASIAHDLAHRFETVEVAADNQAVVDGSWMVIICVRPQIARTVLSQLRFPPDRIVISVMAGIQIDDILELVAPATQVVRAIPLPSVARRNSFTPVHPPNAAARELFDRLGRTAEVTDLSAFEAFSTSTATIAAHFSYLSAISAWLESQQIPPEVAAHYVGSMFAGLGPALRSGRSFDHLAKEHATPGGLNEQFANELAEHGVFARVAPGLQRIFERLHPS